MPIYEYVCPEHGKFEIRAPSVVGNQSTAPCPQCTAPSQRAVSQIWTQAKGYRGTNNQGTLQHENLVREQQELGRLP